MGFSIHLPPPRCSLAKTRLMATRRLCTPYLLPPCVRGVQGLPRAPHAQQGMPPHWVCAPPRVLDRRQAWSPPGGQPTPVSPNRRQSRASGAYDHQQTRPPRSTARQARPRARAARSRVPPPPAGATVEDPSPRAACARGHCRLPSPYTNRYPLSQVEIRDLRGPANGSVPTRTSDACSEAEARAVAAAAAGGAPPAGGGASALAGIFGWAGGGETADDEALYISDVADSAGLATFMLTLSLLLGCALPVVFWRKRQHLSRGLL
jgi:hypothetical protein